MDCGCCGELRYASPRCRRAPKTTRRSRRIDEMCHGRSGDSSSTRIFNSLMRSAVRVQRSANNSASTCSSPGASRGHSSGCSKRIKTLWPNNADGDNPSDGVCYFLMIGETFVSVRSADSGVADAQQVCQNGLPNRLGRAPYWYDPYALY